MNALNEKELAFVQKETTTDFPTYLRSVWNTWPTLKYSLARRKASKLWKSRKEWLKSLEPTQAVLGRTPRKCPTCVSTFHDQWATPSSPILTASVLDSLVYSENLESISTLEEPSEIISSCWGCREDQPNQLAHIDPGGCLYEEDSVDGYDYLPSTLPLLPASPRSTH
jgi:hypothetical protein